jgi:ankyrin repeat protein
MSLLLGAGADVNARLKNAMTPPLGMAIDGGHLPGVKRLLKAGAKTDVLYGRARATPVHAAVSQGAPKILAALIEAGADVNGRSKGGKSALEVAIQEGHDPKKVKRSGGLIAQLLAAGADPKEKNDSGESAIDLARSLGRAHLEQYLTAKT